MNLISDNDFKKIISLKWLPFIGDKFQTIPAPNRILIVGESHYHLGTSESIERNNSPEFTREIIEELAIERNYYQTKIFPNLHKALFRNDDFDSLTFWNLVAFYNFIQRPMETNKGRPTYSDFYNSWFTFIEIITLLKPKTCLFIGTSASHSFEQAIQNTDFITDGVKWDDYISNTYARTTTLKDKVGFETKIIFIRHTSQMFSWKKWNEFLNKKIPDELDWFCKQLEIVDN